MADSNDAGYCNPKKQRHLPQWMLCPPQRTNPQQNLPVSASSSDSFKEETKKSASGLNACQNVRKVPQSKPRKQQATSSDDSPTDGNVAGRKASRKTKPKPVSNVNRVRKRKIRKEEDELLSIRDIDEDNISEFSSSEDVEQDDVLDLTVDDLVRIAKQHIESNDNSTFESINVVDGDPMEATEQVPSDPMEATKQVPRKKSTSVFSSNAWSVLSSTAINSKVGDPIDGNKYTGKPQKLNLLDAGSSAVDRSLHICSDFNRLAEPRDVAEDMIDLLLGPSLSKKSQSTLNQIDSMHPSEIFGTTQKSYSFENTDFVSDSSTSNILSTDLPVLKKKSSLRDKDLKMPSVR